MEKNIFVRLLVNGQWKFAELSKEDVNLISNEISGNGIHMPKPISLTNGEKIDINSISSIEAENSELSNELDDVFSVEAIDKSISESKKSNVRYWDSIESIVENSFNDVALAAGVNIETLGDETILSELRDTYIKLIEERFHVKFPFVNENY